MLEVKANKHKTEQCSVFSIEKAISKSEKEFHFYKAYLESNGLVSSIDST